MFQKKCKKGSKENPWIRNHQLRVANQEFDVVHLVVALHRIAKSTDFQQLRHSAPLREQLAELAKNAAEAEPGIKLIELWVFFPGMFDYPRGITRISGKNRFTQKMGIYSNMI